MTGIRNTQESFWARLGPIREVDQVAGRPRTAGENRAHPHIYNAFVDLKIDGLISIGGDDTLKTANFLHEFQRRLPAGAKRIRVVHLPKTIDNDYEGIDFTFGYFTAVDVMAKELKNLRADAAATASYFIVESMGARRAGSRRWGSPARPISSSASRTSKRTCSSRTRSRTATPAKCGARSGCAWRCSSTAS